MRLLKLSRNSIKLKINDTLDYNSFIGWDFFLSKVDDSSDIWDYDKELLPDSIYFFRKLCEA
jgi:hypothetical protein